MVVSSAKRSASQYFILSGKSFINMRKSLGPNMDPCGTPDLSFENSDSH